MKPSLSQLNKCMDLLEIQRKGLKKRIDPRFRMTRWYEVPTTGDLACHLEWISPDGKCAISSVVLTRIEINHMPVEQILDFVSAQIEDANLELIAFVDEGITP